MKEIIEILFALTIIIYSIVSEIIKNILMLAKTMFSYVVKKLIKKLDSVDIINAGEKKLFIFGSPHAGKSTMTASLVKYLDISDEFIFRRDPISNPEGVLVMRDWIKDYYEGSFPLQTPKDEYTKLSIEYQRSHDPKLKRLIMYEIAGEDVIKFDPTNEGYKDLPEELYSFLLDSRGIIILASATPDMDGEDEIIRDFIEMLIRKKINKPICFVLTKYDCIEDEYENHIQAAKQIYSGAMKLLLNYDKSEVLAYSVGKVDDNKILEDRSFIYIKDILNWIEST